MTSGDRADELRDQARRIRAAVLARHGLSAESAAPPAATARLEEVARRARVTAHWGIASDLPVFGPLLVYWRRALRIGLRWYINPIVEQQNAFNQAVSRALFDLNSENEALRVELASIQSHEDRTAVERPDPA
jgi:hypothetical protein